MNKGTLKLSIEKQINRFINGKYMIDVVCSENIISELETFFNNIDIRKLNHNDRKRLANFCRYNLNNFLQRFDDVKLLKTNSIEQSIMLYGDNEGSIRYEQLRDHCKTNKNIGLTNIEIFLRRNNKKLLKNIQITSIHMEHLKILFSKFDELNIIIYDWDDTISYFIIYDLDNYIQRITKLKNLFSGCKESFILRYGDIEGQKRYKTANTKKLKGLDFSLEKQQERNKKAIQKISGISLYSPRSKYYWLNNGYTDEESIMLSGNIQRRGKEFWIKKYGKIKGTKFWIERNKRWLETMNSKSPQEKRKIARRKAVQIGRASKESLIVFTPLKKYATNKNLKMYLGDSNNIEYFISCKEGFHSYDFTIPKLKLIVEYHGETWHPNPNMSITEKKKWKNPISGIDYIQQHEKDLLKEHKAKNHGFIYIIIWSSDNKKKVINALIKKIDYLINDYS